DDPAATAVVAGLLRDGDAGLAVVRAAAARAEGSAGLSSVVVTAPEGPDGDSTRRALVHLLDDRDEALVDLALRSLRAGAASPELVDPILRAMARAPSSRRASFARTLGVAAVDSKSAAAALVATAREGDREARLASIESLGLVGVLDR